LIRKCELRVLRVLIQPVPEKDRSSIEPGEQQTNAPVPECERHMVRIPLAATVVPTHPGKVTSASVRIKASRKLTDTGCDEHMVNGFIGSHGR
jgi:hypothetical protein